MQPTIESAINFSATDNLEKNERQRLGSQARIPGLDGIRAVSIIMVLFAHLAFNLTPLAARAQFGVQIFFVLSGFLITHLLCVDENRWGQISVPSFYLKRAIRILPPAFVFLAVGLFLSIIGLTDISF